MLLPLRHENMEGRRWPVVTIGLIALNVLIFLGTHWKMDEEAPKEAEVRVHILLLAGMHPELKVPEDIAQWIDSVRTHNPRLWTQIQKPDRRLEDEWDARMRVSSDSTDFQGEMDGLVQQLRDLGAVSVRDRYAFFPGRPTAASYLTANFLHSGWLHLIGNMWFLWLAGFILEDTWGRIIYPIFYMAAGAFALVVHTWANPGSMVPTLGASGAVAGLMGAFLTRFPTLKIEMIWIFGLFRSYRFKAAAYWLLPAWLLTEILYGTLFGQGSGVAHWAHVGGFIFGALVGYGVRRSGLEQAAEKGIQEKIVWVSDPLLAEANEQLEKGELDPALVNLKKLVAAKPDCVEAHRMLQQVYWRKGDAAGTRATMEKLVAIAVKTRDQEEALRCYQEFKTAAGEPLAAATWLDLCRLLEEQPDLSVAAEEYAALASAYPNQKQGLLAQIAAGRIYLKRLNDPQKGLAFYQAAKVSPVPHGEWDSSIASGIEQAQKALAGHVEPALGQ